MKCRICGRNRATTYIEMQGPDGIGRLHLCEACAHERQREKLGPDLEFVLTDLLPSSGGYNDLGPVRICPGCGIAARDLMETEKPGCPECYRVFSAEIARLVAVHQGHDRHVGKRNPERRGGEGA